MLLVLVLNKIVKKMFFTKIFFNTENNILQKFYCYFLIVVGDFF